MIDPVYERSALLALREQSGILHPGFGDLNRSDAVVMPIVPPVSCRFVELRPYCVHLSITGRCNARCEGCVNTSVTFSGEDSLRISKSYDTWPERDARAIVKLLEPLGEQEVVVSFYGGEPLLAPDKVKKVIEALSSQTLPGHCRYMLYTNGQLLDRAIDRYPDLASDIWLWSVSIDGTRAQHNAIRPGTELDIIHRNLLGMQLVRRGEVLMWSTLRESQSLGDCFEEFVFLREQGLAEHFFWHWVETNEPFVAFEDYLKRYETDLTTVMESYTAHLEKGELLSIIHLNELILYLLTSFQRGSSACAVEKQRNFDILGGKVHACADLPPELAIGSIAEDGEPSVDVVDLTSLIGYKRDLGCYECGVHSYCGGRCPVQALTSTAQRLVEYCQLMRLHVGTVMSYLPRIIEQLERNDIALQDIYDRSAFYAQFTDVTP